MSDLARTLREAFVAGLAAEADSGPRGSVPGVSATADITRRAAPDIGQGARGGLALSADKRLERELRQILGC